MLTLFNICWALLLNLLVTGLSVFLESKITEMGVVVINQSLKVMYFDDLASILVILDKGV